MNIYLPPETIIAPEKVRDYLLLPKEEDDKSIFLSLGGFERNNWQVLEKALREQILTLSAEWIADTPYGKKYSIRGALNSPNGKRLFIVSIWILDSATQEYRFVTL